jgi:hypothetical protein
VIVDYYRRCQVLRRCRTGEIDHLRERERGIRAIIGKYEVDPTFKTLHAELRCSGGASSVGSRYPVSTLKCSSSSSDDGSDQS